MNVERQINETSAALALLCSVYHSFSIRFRSISRNPNLFVHLTKTLKYLCEQISMIREKCETKHFKTSSAHQRLLVQKISSLRFFIFDSKSQLEDSPENNSTWLFRFRTSRSGNGWLLRLKAKAEKAEEDVAQILTCLEQIKRMESIGVSSNRIDDDQDGPLILSNKQNDRSQTLFAIPTNPFHNFSSYSNFISHNTRNLNTTSTEKLLRDAITMDCNSQKSFLAKVNDILRIAESKIFSIGQTSVLRDLIHYDVDIRGWFQDGVYFLSSSESIVEVKIGVDYQFIVDDKTELQTSEMMGNRISIQHPIFESFPSFRGRYIVLTTSAFRDSGSSHSALLDILEFFADNHYNSHVAFIAVYAVSEEGCILFQIEKGDEITSKLKIMPSINNCNKPVNESKFNCQGLESREIDCRYGVKIPLAVDAREMTKSFNRQINFAGPIHEDSTALSGKTTVRLCHELGGCDEKFLEIASDITIKQMQKNILNIKYTHSCPIKLFESSQSPLKSKKQEWL